MDLNRNYPYEWGCDYGSSGNTSDETYRGPSPASEPEVQAFINFINAHQFAIRQSYHSYGDLTLYPWAYTTHDSPDESLFREMAEQMTLYNGYLAGQSGEVLYENCGNNFDWDYGAHDEHGKIISFTNEIGNSMWPSEYFRQAYFEENIWPAIYLITMAGNLASTTIGHDSSLRQLRLSQNAPNPFNPKTDIAFALTESGPMSLKVYDVAGRLLSVLVDDVLDAGEHASTWNGRDMEGRPQSSGVYFYQLHAEGKVMAKRMVILK